MNLRKRIISKRIATRLHIEQMKVTRDAQRKLAKTHSHSPLAYQTAHNAVQFLQDKIEKAESELSTLEKRWRV
jgi:hypothetical protein